MYAADILPSCQKDIDKLGSKNPVLAKAVENKMEEIRDFPYHYKPLKYDLAGERRVHVGSFVLKFKINETSKTVIFVFFGHHDEAYKR
jgi:YafQ family addiction module toxin component